MGHKRTRYSAGVAKRPVAPVPCIAGVPVPGVPVPGVLVACIAGGLAAAALWAWRRSERVEVAGLSMAPGLQPGDRLVFWKTTAVRAGDVVAAADPRHPERTVVKRAVAVGGDGVLLLGDNPDQSTDSRHFGRVPVTSVRGKAVYRYAPPARAGRLPRT